MTLNLFNPSFRGTPNELTVDVRNKPSLLCWIFI